MADVQTDFLARYGSALEVETSFLSRYAHTLPTETSFLARTASIQEVDGIIGVCRYAAELETETDFLTRWNDKEVTTDFVARWGGCRGVQTDFRARYAAHPPKATTTGGISGFLYARRTGDATPTFSMTSSSGSVTELCPFAIIVSARESETQAINVQFNDTYGDFHPHGSGSYNSVLEEGAETSITVTWGGAKETFKAVMKDASISQEGPSSTPSITWPGLGYSSKLLGAKRTLETLGSIGRSTELSNRQILQQICDLVSVNCDWNGITTRLVGGPYHRQQLRPSDVLQQVLDITEDLWRDRGDTVEGYDPERGGQHWDYTHADQVIYSHQITPDGNVVYDKVVGLRAIATGKLFATGTETDHTELSDFGEYTVSLPNLSAVTSRYTYREYTGAATGFKYETPTGTVLRVPVPGTNYGTGLTSGPIVGATSVTFTWGAANEGVSRDGVTSAAGGISFYGTPTHNGQIGLEGPTDMTTRAYAGDVNGTSVLELSPTPLIANGTDLQALADKVFRLNRYPTKTHTLVVPLNHLLTVGDWVTIGLSSLLGGGSIGPCRVTAYQHVVTRQKGASRTTITLREYVGA